jgi:hypothetical protein
MLVAEPSALTSAAGQVDGIAGTLADVDVASPFAEAADALVGSETSQACLWVSTRLGAAVQVYADRVRNLADAARLTAVDLSCTDDTVGRSFGTS